MWTWLPRFTTVAATVYLGVLAIIIVGAPLYAVAESKEIPTWSDNILAFARWTRVLLHSGPEAVFAVVFLCYPIGFVAGECAYRVGWLTRLHGRFEYIDMEKSGQHSESLAQRYETALFIQEDEPSRTVFDWEFFMFALLYSMETAASLFVLSFTLSTVTIGATRLWLAKGVHTDTGGGLASLLLIVLGTGLLLLLRQARREKIAALRHLYKAIEQRQRSSAAAQAKGKRSVPEGSGSSE